MRDEDCTKEWSNGIVDGRAWVWASASSLRAEAVTVRAQAFDIIILLFDKI